jgi:hypothetical protein
MAIVTRLGKGAPLTAAELDNNFIELSIAAGLVVGGPGTIDGSAIDSTLAVSTLPRIFDVTGTSRPIAIDIVCGAGDSILMATTNDPDGLVDADHESWEIVRASSGASVIEIVNSAYIVGIQILRTAGSSLTSTVRVYAPLRGPGYNPVYDPAYDVAFEDATDAARFLRQASFGYAPTEPAALVLGGTVGETLDSWFGGSPAYMMGAAPVIAESASAGDNTERRSLAAGMHWRAIYAPTGVTTLCARFASAFNKMLAIGPIGGSSTSTPHEAVMNRMIRFLADDETTLDYLRWLQYARQPNLFLDNANNPGRDPNSGWTDREPNQNFAREILQLFSLGQWELNLDGTFKLDGSGNLIPAYEYQDVLNYARILSGMNQAGTVYDLPMGTTGTTANWTYRGAVEMPTAGISRAAYAEHPAAAPLLGTKHVISDQPYGMVERVVQWLYNNDTMLVYFARNFINELVTENPTPQYVRRVVASLLDDGTGRRGSFRAMVRAILLDAEARGTSKPADTYGRALDIHLAISAGFRAAEPQFAAEFATINCGCTNGSTAITFDAEQGKQLQVNASSDWRVTGVGIPASTSAEWTGATTGVLSQAFTGTTGTVSLTFARNFGLQYFESFEGPNDEGAGRLPTEWGHPNSVFADYPFDAEGAPGFLARAARIWTADAIRAFWYSTIRSSMNHHPTSVYGGTLPAREGVWNLTTMTAGTPTNADLIDRAVSYLLHGRTLPAGARTVLINALDGAMTDSATWFGAPDDAVKLSRRAALALSMVNLMPEALEQV